LEVKSDHEKGKEEEVRKEIVLEKVPEGNEEQSKTRQERAEWGVWLRKKKTSLREEFPPDHKSGNVS